MKIVSSAADAASLTDPELRALVEKTIAALSEDHPYDPDVLGYFLIVQPGDSLGAIDAQIGFDILCNRWTGIRFDQPGYGQSFECIDEFAGYYELVFIISDDGFGIEVFISKSIDIPDLLAMCQRFAVAGKL